MSRVLLKVLLFSGNGDGKDIKVYLADADVTEVTDLVELYEAKRETIKVKKGQFVFFVYGADESENMLSVSIGKANTTFTPASLNEILTSGQTESETRIDYIYGAVGKGSVALFNIKKRYYLRVN